LHLNPIVDEHHGVHFDGGHRGFQRTLKALMAPPFG
jgi:hypothetical protein